MISVMGTGQAKEIEAVRLPRQFPSSLLWAPHSVNRPESGQRTAPSAHDWREIDVCLAAAEGTPGLGSCQQGVLAQFGGYPAGINGQ